MVTTFFSYRHETDAHRDKVRALASHLESEGITIVLDQFAQEREFHGGGPDEGWPHWSTSQAGNPDHKVLIIASSGWFRCYEGLESGGTGLGAAAEAVVVRQRLYNAYGKSADIRVVCFDSVDPLGLPLNLQPFHRFVLPSDLKDLVSWLNATSLDIVPSVAQGWPDVAPLLAWPVADHTCARTAFGQLITRGSKHRFLPIKGDSETGKSLLTNQMLRNAMNLEGLACGRLDFKGTTDIGIAVSNFVQQLGINAPPAEAGVSAQLSKILNDLAARSTPALLIFDTFENAGEAEKWVSESLLPRITKADWLRVVIAGQKVPRCQNEFYSDFCASMVELQSPSPEDWYAYGIENNKPDLTLEIVRHVHRLADGKSSMISQLLGPAA